MILERPTIVVSPLLALMADQERALRSYGVPVIVFHSRLRAVERRAALQQFEGSGCLVVLTTPETLESRAIAPWFERARPALLCVDEAHWCASPHNEPPLSNPPSSRQLLGAFTSVGILVVSPFAATLIGAIDILDGAVVVVERDLAVSALVVAENTFPPLIADSLAVRRWHVDTTPRAMYVDPARTDKH
jgi:hypothetical protein